MYKYKFDLDMEFIVDALNLDEAELMIRKLDIADMLEQLGFKVVGRPSIDCIETDDPSIND
jgi:hypothetical protein